jgi:RNA polymerase sigma-70 factor (ECF subfamily)
VNEDGAIDRLRAGDATGLEYLVRTHQEQAVRAAYLVTRDRPLAEDIVQSAFLRFYDRIDQFDRRRPFRPYFLRIVVNDALKAMAKARRQVALELDEMPDLGWWTDLLDRSGSSLEVAGERAQLREAVWNALRELPVQEYAAIVLRYYAGLTDAEISHREDVPVGTVKWRLHAARGRLREILSAWQPDAPPPAANRESPTSLESRYPSEIHRQGGAR